MKRILFFAAIFLFSVALASAQTFTVKLHQPSTVEGTELKPGNYKVELSETRVVITNGRLTVEAPVRQEESDVRFPATSVRYVDVDGTTRIREIRVGGSKIKVIFDLDGVAQVQEVPSL